MCFALVQILVCLPFVFVEGYEVGYELGYKAGSKGKLSKMNGFQIELFPNSKHFSSFSIVLWWSWWCLEEELVDTCILRTRTLVTYIARRIWGFELIHIYEL